MLISKAPQHVLVLSANMHYPSVPNCGQDLSKIFTCSVGELLVLPVFRYSGARLTTCHDGVKRPACLFIQYVMNIVPTKIAVIAGTFRF
jgi:hypothetical protein